ncbi:hypothetical protein EPO17_01815 [Patescibacteria group bacterium]|nr:MAG: hypothetical protein EPO17_01815 [Patescibacteria group bacterium]
MNPIVSFVRSIPYERVILSLIKKDQVLPNADFKKHIDAVESLWLQHSGTILGGIATILKLQWYTPQIKCYILNAVIGHSFSDPLTVQYFKTPEEYIHTLTHELIHCILIENQNQSIIKKSWENLIAEYKSESRVTRVHIIVHAVHEIILKKLFPEQLEKEKVKVDNPHYIKSWEIVDRVGAEKVVEKFIKAYK